MLHDPIGSGGTCKARRYPLHGTPGPDAIRAKGHITPLPPYCPVRIMDGSLQIVHVLMPPAQARVILIPWNVMPEKGGKPPVYMQITEYTCVSLSPSGDRWQAVAFPPPPVPPPRLPPSRRELTIVKQLGVKHKGDAVS